MDVCLAAQTVKEVRVIVERIKAYILNPASFVFDQAAEKANREALVKRKIEEGKRKAFEARMQRKAKREGKELDFYLKIGAEPPTFEGLEELRCKSRDEGFEFWKTAHSQHCFAFHLDKEGCKRDRACPFLHTDVKAGESIQIYG
jgi:hypothetical protein